MNTFPELIDQWPSMAALAADLEQKPDTVQKWRLRGMVPVDYWPSLIAAGRRRGVKLSANKLLALSQRRVRA